MLMSTVVQYFAKASSKTVHKYMHKFTYTPYCSSSEPLIGGKHTACPEEKFGFIV